jgi:hypothetical protein
MAGNVEGVVEAGFDTSQSFLDLSYCSIRLGKSSILERPIGIVDASS